MFDRSGSSGGRDGEPSTGVGLAAVLERLEELSEQLVGLAPGEVSDGELSDALLGLDRVRNRLDAATAGVAGAWDARQVWAGDGCRSGPSWLAARTELSKPAASAQVRLGRRLGSMPHTEVACRSGELGQAKARLLAKAAKAAPELFCDHEKVLVDQALRLRVDEFARVVEYWIDRAVPDDAAADAARQRERRGVSLSQTLDGSWRLEGVLTPEDGELLDDALGRVARRLHDAAVGSGGICAETWRQHRADALVDLARQAVVNPQGTAVNCPSVTVVVDFETWMAARHPAEPVGRTDTGSPVSAEAARRFSCDGSVARVVMAAGSTPIDLGTGQRLPSPAQRRALAIRDRGCVFPGCDAPPGWTSAHHVVHWTNGGPTDMENLVSLCSFHHHRVHEGGYGIARHPDGTIEATRPDGTAIHVTKATTTRHDC